MCYDQGPVSHCRFKKRNQASHMIMIDISARSSDCNLQDSKVFRVHSFHNTYFSKVNLKFPNKQN